MPEGHSLELAARRLAPIVGRTVLAGPLAGAQVTAIEARGKHLLIHADDGRSADVHLGMHGRARLLAPGYRTHHARSTPLGDANQCG